MDMSGVRLLGGCGSRRRRRGSTPTGSPVAAPTPLPRPAPPTPGETPPFSLTTASRLARPPASTCSPANAPPLGALARSPRSAEGAWSPAGGAKTLPRSAPGAVNEAQLGLVGALVCVRAEGVALRLREVLRQPRRAVAVEVREARPERRHG